MAEGRGAEEEDADLGKDVLVGLVVERFWSIIYFSILRIKIVAEIYTVHMKLLQKKSFL